jgi:hypothetical protein
MNLQMVSHYEGFADPRKNRNEIQGLLGKVVRKEQRRHRLDSPGVVHPRPIPPVL